MTGDEKLKVMEEKASDPEDVPSNEEADNENKDVTNKKKKKKKKNKGKSEPKDFFRKKIQNTCNHNWITKSGKMFDVMRCQLL